MRYDTRTALVMKKASRGPAAIALRQQRILRPTQTGVEPAAGVIQAGLAGPAKMMVPQTGKSLVRYGVTGRDVVSAGTPVGSWSLAGTGRERAAGSFGRVSAAQAGALLVGAGVGSQSMGASRLVSAGINSGPLALRGFGAVDTAAIAQKGASVGAGYAATGATYVGASFVGAGAAAGSVVPVVGTIVGAIVALAVAEILHKNYINVADINRLQDAQVKIFDQYKSIQGQVPGRAIGFDVMKAIWKGAQNRGYFGTHGAGAKQCFHEGCFKYPGRGDWIDSDYSTSGASWQWGGVLKNWLAGRQAGAVSVQTNLAPRSVVVAPRAYQVARATGLRGLGSFGAVQMVSDAVSFVDNYFIPANANRWAAPSNQFEHNMLYDLADAFLANQPGISTQPYIALAPPPPPVTTPQPTQVVPAQSSGPSATTSYPGYTFIGPDGSGRPLYLANSDGNKLNQNIPIYTPIGGVMTPTGQTFYNAATNVVGAPVNPAAQPGNTYPLVPISTPSGGTVYQPNPNAPQAAAPAAAPGTNWGPLIALAAGAAYFIK